MIESKSIALPTWRYPSTKKRKFEINVFVDEAQEKTSPAGFNACWAFGITKIRSKRNHKLKRCPSRASLFADYLVSRSHQSGLLEPFGASD
jgi:hypothetical protein